ncbi:MAG: hypothetical protein JWO31_1812, partial [Phycisphaerales bacterium]|nr:hypothetical protein [Phycisphaerales bacterium]
SAEAIISAVHAAATVDRLPREIVLELTARRATAPIFSPLAASPIDRSDLPLDLARRVIDELADLDDARLTLAGVGDPLLHPDLLAVVAHAVERGVAVHVETDLLPTDPAAVDALGGSAADVVSVHLPAVTPATYAVVMGVDAYEAALRNVQAFVTARAAAGRGTPVVAPLFVKCRQNQHEMEAWYDQWLRAVGSAVIVGPTTFGGLLPGVAAADMTPPQRVPCRRLTDRLTVLSDGRYVTCEQDPLGRQAAGRAGVDALAEVWGAKFAALRKHHADMQFGRLHPVCAACTEWHRP